MRVLITGVAGTIGRPLARVLKDRGHEVWGCDLQHWGLERYVRADVSIYRQMEALFKLSPFDMVVHLAAEFGRLNGEEYYDTLWQTNVVGTRNILELQRIFGFRLIFASSSEIYGETDALLTEELPLRQPVIQHNDYALSKWVNEVQIMNFEKRYGNPVMRLRFFNAYGPGEHYHHYRSVVCLFCYRALHHLPYDVYTGYSRVFMFLEDFIPTLARACERFMPGAVLNIGGTEFRTVEELSNLVLQATKGDPSLVRYKPVDLHNTLSKRPDITKAVELLDHRPVTTLEEGVPRTVEWMKQFGV
mgnify:FL=1